MRLSIYAVESENVLTAQCRIRELHRLGYMIGNPNVKPCKHCGWRHEQRGRCTWCGQKKKKTKRNKLTSLSLVSSPP